MSKLKAKKEKKSKKKDKKREKKEKKKMKRKRKLEETGGASSANAGDIFIPVQKIAKGRIISSG